MPRATTTPPTADAAVVRKSLVYRSAQASLFAQVVITLVTASGFFLPLPDAKRGNDLEVILALELSSQIVEFVWYAVALWRVQRIRTWTRYLDWVVSTPVMLLSTSLFFHHRRAVPLGDVFRAYPIYLCLSLNWVMLAFGFAMEREWIPRAVGLAGGGLSFVGSFTALALVLGDGAVDELSWVLFLVMYAVWGMYGIAAALSDTAKNVAYNGLDIVSKNFYGVFLVVYGATL
jgi:hypothetical protein